MKEQKIPSFSALDRQREIYIKGISGQRPLIPLDFAALEAKAAQLLPAVSFNYIAGGAGIGETIQNNRSGFSNWQIIPRMMRDVSVRDTSTTLFGQDITAPIFLSPVGVLELAHPQADIAVRKAATAMGIPYVFSNQASRAIEECAAAGTGPFWFQLYWSKSNDLVASFLERAERSGCTAIVVTLDTTMLGWRIPDLDYAYLPFLYGKGIAQYISDPVFQQIIDEEPSDEEAAPVRPLLSYDTLRSVVQLMSSYPGSFFRNLRSRRPLKAVQKFINIYSRPSLSWNDLPFLRQHTKLPILLKGILHPDDARLALDHGVDGIIVSNHGGRQVDGAISSIHALPKVVEAVEGQIPVLLDSGIRTGADIFKALALGATAVGIGRPYVYGLAIAGEQGVGAVIKNLSADFELTMGLAGCRSITEIDRKCLT